MTLWETLCSIWVFAVLASATLGAWQSAEQVIRWTTHYEFAEQCADDAAERWMSHVQLLSGYQWNGEFCEVEVSSHENSLVVHVSANCAGVRYELWIPSAPGANA